MFVIFVTEAIPNKYPKYIFLDVLKTLLNCIVVSDVVIMRVNCILIIGVVLIIIILLLSLLLLLLLLLLFQKRSVCRKTNRAVVTTVDCLEKKQWRKVYPAIQLL